MATVPLATYLWTRIRQAGVESVMGVPGDFNLNFLDHIYNVKGLKYIGNSNELNAAYAADGYARIKETPGCVVTTHGVGELSAINGIAGSASEHVPVIHVVGQTFMAAQNNHLMIHHSIGFNVDHQMYNKMSQPVRYSAAELASSKDPTSDIDRVIRDCVIQKQPVYVFLPIDKTEQPVSSSALNTPINFRLPVDTSNEDSAVSFITEALYAAKNAAVLVDYLALRYARAETQKLVEKLNLPHYSSHMGKGCVNEEHENFVGVYNGRVSVTGAADAIESCDLVLSVGWFQADTNTAYFSRKIAKENHIDVMPDHVIVQGKRFDNVYMAPLLARLTSTIDTSKLTKPEIPKVGSIPPAKDGNEISHAYAWPKIGDFLRPGDVVLADTGTATYGLPDVRVPHDMRYIAQSYYMSIGFTGPAALGADIALSELHKQGVTKQRGRTILCIGDGSLMLTIQEVGTMIMKKLPIIIVIINNAGYTIERAIHGARQPYNDIPSFNYSHLLPLFSGTDPKQDTSLNYRLATTRKELDNILSESGLANPKETQVLEVRMDPFDLPWKLAKILKARNPEHVEREGFKSVE